MVQSCCVCVQGLTNAFGDTLPDEDILERSEFLLPLSEAMRRLYWEVLHPELSLAEPCCEIG